MLWCILCIVICMNSRCIGQVVSGGTCVGHVLVPKRSAQAHATPHTLMQLHMSVWYSVPDVLHSTPRVMRVYWWHYTRISLCVTQIWELPVPWYHVIYGDVAEDMYVIYMWDASLNCISCYSLPTNSHNPSPAITIKLIYSVSIGSTVASGAQLLFTGAQLLRRVVDCRELELPTAPLGRIWGCCGLLAHMGLL